MGRRWVPLVVIVVGALLGLAVAGLPDRSKDEPLGIQTSAPPTTVAPTAPTVPLTTTTTSPPPATRAPSELKAVAINASGVAGAGARLTERLESEGYDAGQPTSRRVQAASAVLHRPGLDSEARALAASLGIGASALEPTEAPPDDADLAVIIGEDVGSRL